MGETLAKDGCAMSQAFFGPAHLSLDVWHVKTTNILEFDSLEQIPNAFLWIELRSIARQAFEMDAFGSALSQKVFDRLRAMNGSSIPDDQQVAWDLAQEQLQEADHIRPFVGMVLSLHTQLSFQGNRPDGREMVMGQRNLQQRRLADGSIGMHRHWQQIEPRFIYEHDAPFFLFGLFFSSSHRCSFQVWIAASLRWVAFWMGFC
jgi:hypothetical protein